MLDEVGGDGVYSRYVFGVSIFALNEVDVPAEMDPRVAFCTELARSNRHSAHLGCDGYSRIADSLDKILLRPREWDTSAWTVNQGDLYPIKPDWPPALILPEGVCPGVDLGFAEVDDLLLYDSLSFYLLGDRDPIREISVALPETQMLSMAAMDWVLNASECVVFTEGDNWCFHALSRDPAAFTRLDSAIAAATRCIEDATWYQERRDRLVWRGNPDNCLVDPEGPV
ncbi:MAG TPA: hypothetical protein VGM37_03720 [Armatimonadota bacterium]|jgi:hypothetical protein